VQVDGVDIDLTASRDGQGEDLSLPVFTLVLLLNIPVTAKIDSPVSFVADELKSGERTKILDQSTVAWNLEIQEDTCGICCITSRGCPQKYHTVELGGNLEKMHN
jgi:hypothetical protein